MYALVDGNNFYVSCERVFRPSLRGRPVVVLSNNDGCAIARSNEAKDLGIPMAAPWHEIRAKLPDAGIVALSANFTLYGDMSNRMMSLAAGLGPEQEIYSIDECFVDLSGMPGDLAARSHRLRQRIEQWIGVPCGIGIGVTKTLAKLANHVAKTAARRPGSYPAALADVCDLAILPRNELDAVFAGTPLDDIWGIGPRIAAQLKNDGLTTVLDVVRMDPAAARRRWSVTVERTVRELQGQPCFGFEDTPPPRKEIASTRAFGDPVSQLAPLVQAVSEYASRAAFKLRSQNSHAGQVMVFVHTNPFRKWEKQYAKSITVPLRRPLSDTASIVTAAVRGVHAIWQAGYNLHKAGVILMDLQDASVLQHELSLDDAPAAAVSAGRDAVMRAMDRINDRYGRGTMLVAASGLGGDQRSWTMKQQWRTPQYTTCWDDMPVARA
jgi:DNA polymerase V